MTNTNSLKKDFPIYHTNWLNRLTIIDHIQAAATSYANGLLLDVGCGAKPYRELFADRTKSYLGFDLKLPNPHSRGVGPDMLASSLKLPLPDNTFDTIVSFQVLEHVPEPQVMVSEIARVLKPDGYLVLMAPQMWNLHEVPHDYFRYTRYGLKYMAEHAGLTVIKIQPISGFWIRAGLVTSYHIYQMLPGRRVRNWLIVRFIIHTMIAISNLIFCAIDKLWPIPTDPINNLLIASKNKRVNTN